MFDSYVRGFHVYQTVCSPLIGEDELKCRHEKENEEDEFAIGVYGYNLHRETLVGHIPRNITKFVYTYLQLRNSKLYCRVTGKILNRDAENGLEIPVTYTLNVHEKAIEWMESKMHEDIKTNGNLKDRSLK